MFFFVVGLEIKRELVSGQLASKRASFLPIAAAAGGMAAPALIYLAIAGGSAPRGWAIAVAAVVAAAMSLAILSLGDGRAATARHDGVQPA